MNNNRKVIAGLFTAAALAASSSFVYAQADKGPGQGAERGGMHHGMRGGDGQRGHGGRHGQWSNPKAAVEGHLAALKVELKITPNQENAWQAFANKARQQADARFAQHEKWRAQRNTQAQPASASAPDALAQRTERMKQHVASMEARTAAVKDLYAALTPEQKTIADKQFSRGDKRGFHGRGGFRGHDGGGFRGHGGHGERQQKS